MGHELHSLRWGALVLATACNGVVIAPSGGKGTPAPAFAEGVPVAAPGPDGAPLVLPAGKPLSWLDDGVPIVAASGAGPSAGTFGARAELRAFREIGLLPGGKEALVELDGDRAGIVSLAGGKVRWETAASWISLVRVAPDGSRVAVLDDGTVVVLDAKSGSAMRGPTEVSEVAFSSDGARIAAASRGGVTLVLDAATLEERARLEAPGYGAVVVEFSPDGRRLLTAESGTCRVWDLAKKRAVYVAAIEHATAFAWADDRTLLVGTSQGKLLRADVDRQPRPAEADEIARLPGPIQAIQRIRGRDLFVVDLERTFASVFDLSARKEIVRLQKTEHGRTVLAPDGKTLAVVGTRTQLFDLELEPKLVVEPRSMAAAHLAAVDAVASRGDRVASGGSDGALAVWSARDRKLLARRVGLDAIRGVSLAPASAPRRFASAAAVATDEGDVIVFDAALETRIATFHLGEPTEYYPMAVAFAPDGKHLVASGGERSILYDAAKRKIVAAYGRSFRQAVFTAELAVVGPNPTRVLRRKDGAELRVAEDHVSRDDSFALGLLEGNYAVSASAGRYSASIRALGAQEKPMGREDLPLSGALAFSPDGALLVGAAAELTFVATADGKELGQEKLLEPAAPDQGREYVAAITFDDDGGSVFVGYESGVVGKTAVRVRVPDAPTLVPGVGGDALPPLVGLAGAERAIGPRDLRVRAVADASQRELLDGPALAFSADGSAILVSRSAYELQLFDVASRSPSSIPGQAAAYRLVAGPRRFASRDPYGDRIAILGADPVIDADESCHAVIPVDGESYVCLGSGQVALLGPRGGGAPVAAESASTMAVAPNGARFALAGDEVAVFDVNGSTIEAKGSVAVPRAAHLAFSRDGARLFVASHGVALMFDAASAPPKLLRIFEGQGEVDRVYASADGSRLATYGDEVVRIWDTASGKVVALLEVGSIDAASAMLRGDGKAFLVAEDDLATWTF
jgi:WD40 repeat protein